jgi:hypothetical protein
MKKSLGNDMTVSFGLLMVTERGDVMKVLS